MDKQGEVLFINSEDGGDLMIVDGLISFSGGLETAVYLSLFGGNKDDNSQDNTYTWWANLVEDNESYKYISETQYLLSSLPVTTRNLIRLEEAAKRDLDWLLNENIATEVNIQISVPQINKVFYDIKIDNESFSFTENWNAM